MGGGEDAKYLFMNYEGTNTGSTVVKATVYNRGQ